MPARRSETPGWKPKEIADQIEGNAQKKVGEIKKVLGK